MENFEKVVKLASCKLGNGITINYNNGQFSWSCGAYGQDNLDNLNDLEESVKQAMYKSWLVRELMQIEDTANEDNGGSKFVYESIFDVTPEDELVDLKTRTEWSRGRLGDPRKRQAGQKFIHTKTQILALMAKAVNGRFSSEKISREQYIKEFKYENKKAVGRYNWHNRYKAQKQKVSA
jgi:hypothetical protein